MKRVLVALALVIGALSLAATAWAKEANLEVSGFPTGLGPGEPWDALIVVSEGPVPAGAPTVTIRNAATGEKQIYRSTSRGHEGMYDSRVVFPSAGTWTYEVTDPTSGRTYQYDPVTIAAPVAETPSTPPAKPAPVPADPGSFPVWPVIGGVLGFVLVALVLALLSRGRPRPASLA